MGSTGTLRRQAVPTTLALLVLVMAFSVGGEIVGGARALAVHVSCGDTITADTTLDSDLLDCPNNGIVIGADDITLDLNGFTVSGDGEPFESCPEDEPCDIGLLNDGHDGVTITNGSVRGFAVGVFVGGAHNNRVVSVSSSTNAFFGILVTASARSVIRDSSGNGNVPPEGDGMALFGSHRIRVLDNTFNRNGLGVHVEDSTNSLFRGNIISRNEGPGIFMQANRNEMRGNICHQNGICILVGPGNRNVIARNRVRGDVGGIAVEKGRHNLIARNLVTRTRKTGIFLGVASLPIGGGSNVVRRNVVKGSGTDAFKVNRKDDHSVLKHNVAKGAGDDGFGIQSGTAKLTGNRAIGNDDLGIRAVAGVVDGGGNIARRNGDPRQCVNISCS